MPVIEYRRFRNSDPPQLARIWNSRPPLATRIPTLNARLLDETALAPQYFDPAGLCVATDDARVIGFAHAGFGPAADGTRLDPARGCVSTVAVESLPHAAEVAAELIARCEGYLRERGARGVFAGGPGPVDPFYLGLDGGSRCEGVPAADGDLVAWFRAAGYRELGRRSVEQKSLRGYRSPMDRTHMQWQRAAVIDRRSELAADSWWDACTLAQHERQQFRLSLRPPAYRKADLLVWDVQPLADASGQRMAGLIGWTCDEQAWTDGLLRFLLADTLRRLLENGVTLVEAQVGPEERGLEEVLRGLGFQPVTEKILLVKDL